MTETPATPIPITGLTRSRTHVTEELHFTGGMRAKKVGNNWQIGPVLRDGRVGAINGVSEGEIRGLGVAMGLTLFGGDEIVDVDPGLPARIWTPLLGLPLLTHQPSDTWGMITAACRAAGDDDYARLARSLSVSLRAAGLQMRNASDEYHRQLLSALARGQKVGTRFANIPMMNLHLAFHSVVIDMASARDYLAQVAARRVGAPSGIDALNRLKQWVEKPVNAAAQNDALVARLLEASDLTKPDPWLADITEYRNLFLHREHMGANETANRLAVEERESPVGPVRIIAMAINVRPGIGATCDALRRFVDLNGRLCRLADFAATLAPYPATPPTFVVTGH
jgi:hypothetical protein